MRRSASRNGERLIFNNKYTVNFKTMEIEDIKGWWEISPEENLQEGCELKCPECCEWASHKEWRETSVYCEDCGEHAAIRCPHCEEDFDHVWSKTFECRVPS